MRIEKKGDKFSRESDFWLILFCVSSEHRGHEADKWNYISIHVTNFFLTPATQRVKFHCVAGASEVATQAQLFFGRVATITWKKNNIITILTSELAYIF